RYERYLHSRHVEIEAESLRAVALVPAVETPDSRADQPEIGWLLERDRRRHGDARGVGGQFFILCGLSGRATDDTGFRAALARRDLPSLRGGRDEHGARPRAQLPVLLERCCHPPRPPD